MYDIETIIREIEATLMIDGSFYAPSVNVNDIIPKVRESLTTQYGLNFKGDVKIEDIEQASMTARSSLVMFQENLIRIHSQISGWVCYCSFRKESPLSLEHINYLGAAKKAFEKTLAFAQDTSKIRAVKDAMDFILQQLTVQQRSMEKRLLLSMCVAYNLGCYEIVGAIAMAFTLGQLINDV